MVCYNLPYNLRYSCGCLATLLWCTCLPGICLLFFGSISATGQLHMPEKISTSHLHMQHDFRNYDSSEIGKLLKDSIHTDQSSSDEALMFYEDILLQSRKINYGRGAGIALYGMGQVYFNRSMYPQAFQSYRAAAAIFRAHKLERELGGAYNNIANVYKIQGVTQQAVYYYYLAARIAYTTRDSILVPNIYYNLGLLFKYSEQGLYYFKKAETLAKRYGKHEMLGLIYMTKAEMLGKQKEWHAALSLLNEASTLGKAHNLPVILYKNYLHYANLYNRKNEPERALEYATKARALKDSLSLSFKNEYFWMNLYDMLMGNILVNMKAYHQAQPYLIQALETATSLNIKQQRAEAHKLLASNYEYTGNYKKSLEHQRVYQEIRDSIMNETVIKNINNLEVKYRIAEKDREIAIKEAKLKNRDLLIGGISAGGILLMTGSLVYYRHLKQKQKLLRQQQEIEKLKTLMAGEEKERNRIARELHDGIMVRFSSVKMNLGAIMKRFPPIPQINDLKDTITQLDNATQELRNSAHNLMPDMLLKDGLTAAIKYFCNSITPDGVTEITFQQYGATPHILPEYELMIYRIVQELVQNALKYARAKTIIIQLDNTQGLFTITVEDNGEGFDTKNLLSVPGSGLNSICSRIHAIGGTTEVISAAGRGTTIYIEMEIVTLQSDSSLS